MSNFWQQLPKPILALAPMCGVTDLPFRLLCKEHGADLVYTEMTMVQSLSRRNPAALRLAQVDASEQPVIIQLGGKEPEHFRKAAQIARELGASGIDINMGCPAKRVAGNGSGVSLLRDHDLARQGQRWAQAPQGDPFAIDRVLRGQTDASADRVDHPAHDPDRHGRWAV